jgi:GNAT superfamily N-acetyltransferase
VTIQSLGLRTTLLFARFAGHVIDRGHYTLVQTPQNPGFHWGNFIILDGAPQAGSLRDWTELFDREFRFYKEPHHRLFVWEDLERSHGDLSEFIQAGFEHETSIVLSAPVLRGPRFAQTEARVRPVATDRDWDEVVQLQVQCGDPAFSGPEYLRFKQRQFLDYRRMAEAGMGAWFGAYLGGKLVGDLGIFFEGEVGRYQNVETHPDYRGQGICGHLVHQAGLAALARSGIRQLVIVADPGYHAARIYDSVGFRPRETIHALARWKGK